MFKVVDERGQVFTVYQVNKEGFSPLKFLVYTHLGWSFVLADKFAPLEEDI